jgi:hypothetical protein
VQITGPWPVRQQTLQSTCQQVLLAADAGGEDNSAANPVDATAANRTIATHLVFFLIVYLLGIEINTPTEARTLGTEHRS